MQAEAKETAVVILNWNGLSWLQTFLQQVIDLSPEADVIVADNGSTDGSLAYLKSLGVWTLELGHNYGFAGGYNHALQQLPHTFTVLLNSDVEVSQNWLKPLINRLKEDPSLGAVQPKIKAYKNKNYFEFAGASGGFLDALAYPYCRGRIFDTLEPDAGQYDQATKIHWASGAAFAIQRSLFIDHHGFDEDFFAHQEEIDLCWRLRNAGYSIMVEPEAVVYHVGGGTLDYENPRKVFLNFRNNLWMLTKNHPQGDLATVLVIFFRLVLDGLAGIQFLLKGKWKSTWAIVRAHFAFYAGLPQKWKVRQYLKFQNSGKPQALPLQKGSIVFQYFLSGKKRFNELG